jgi:hypothetical protein
MNHHPGNEYMMKKVKPLPWGNTSVAAVRWVGPPMLRAHKAKAVNPTLWHVDYQPPTHDVFPKPHFRHPCHECNWLGGFVFDVPFTCQQQSVHTRYVDLYFHGGEKASFLVRFGHDLRHYSSATFHGVKTCFEKPDPGKIPLHLDHTEFAPAFAEAYRRHPELPGDKKPDASP